MRLSARQLPWLWLLIGFVLVPFAGYQAVVPLAAWIAPVFLLRFVRTCERGRTALLLVLVAYVAGVLIDERGTTGTSIALVWGLTGYPLVRGVLYTLPYAADRLIGPRLGTWPRLFIFPSAFVIVDWLGSLGATGTFGSPAYSQAGDLPLLQIVSVTGMWGLTFLMAWFASTINAAWEHGFRWREVRGPVALFGAALVGVFLFGVVRLNVPAPATPELDVAMVTADGAFVDGATQGIDWATFNQSTDEQRAAVRPRLAATVDAMLARTEAALRQGAKVVAWPEGSTWVLDEDRQSAIDRAATLANRYDAYLEVTFGVLTRAPGLNYLRNQAILVGPTGAVVWTYDKTKPVFPSESIVTLAGPGVLPLADTAYGRLSTAICNDMGFPGLLLQAGTKDVDVLFAPTHSMFSVWAAADAAEATFRTVENGFVLVRSTGNGPSLITDPEGRTLARRDDAGTGGILLARIPTRGVVTIYSRLGDLFVYLCMLGLAGLVGLAFVQRRPPIVVAGPQTA
jgi:apolipoprotein N-acyltransferase